MMTLSGFFCTLRIGIAPLISLAGIKNSQLYDEHLTM